jgi:putative DNA primase/helicase
MPPPKKVPDKGAAGKSSPKPKIEEAGDPKSGLRSRTIQEASSKSKSHLKAVPPPQEVKKAPFWRNNLVEAKRGSGYAPCSANVTLILSHDKEWEGVLKYDEFVGDVVSAKLPPWPDDMKPANMKIGEWSDRDMTRAGQWLARKYDGMICNEQIVAAGVHVAAERYLMHPVKDWLRSLKWDGGSRIDTFLIRLAGAKDTDYSRAIGSKFLISAVARVMKPGCQADSMPVFEGAQGTGKTSMLRILGGKWFASTSEPPGTKDSYQALRGVWIVEYGELDALSKSEADRIKQHLSTAIDRYRPSYARKAADFPRQSVYAGTVNPAPSGYLKDSTGARRFWPILLGKINLKALAAERDQLWAEAVAKYDAGATWHLEGPKLLAAAAEEADDRRQADLWEAIVGNWLLSNSSLWKDGVTTEGILEGPLRFTPDRIERGHAMRVATVIRTLGWTESVKARVGGAVTRLYRPSASALEALQKSRVKLKHEEAERKRVQELRKAERLAAEVALRTEAKIVQFPSKAKTTPPT